MSDTEALASLREAVYHVTGRTMTMPQAYLVARFLLDAGWTHPNTEGRTDHE